MRIALSKSFGNKKQSIRTVPTLESAVSEAQLVDELREHGVLIRTRSYRGVAEEAFGAYVAEATERAKLARRVARLVPVICVKG